MFYTVDFFSIWIITIALEAEIKASIAMSNAALERPIALPSRQKERKKKEEEENDVRKRFCSLVANKYGNLDFHAGRYPDLRIPCTTHFYGTRQPFCGFLERTEASAQRIFPVLPFADSRVPASRFITVWPSTCLLHAGFLLFVALLPVRRVAWKERND